MITLALPIHGGPYLSKPTALVALAIFVPIAALVTLIVVAAIALSSGSSNDITGDLNPSWSPDGTKIAFSSDRDGKSDIYVMRIDTGEQVKLTTNTGSNTEPTWSPDGTLIAFLSRGERGTDIHVVRPDGTGQTYLTNFPAYYSRPVWSPDSNRMVFTSNRDLQPIQRTLAPNLAAGVGLPPAQTQLEIYVMNADGSEQTRLTFNKAFEGNPSWSPDGARIAFQSKRDSNHEIYVMNADGSGVSNLTQNDRDDVNPAWSPDGARIAFSSNRPLVEFRSDIRQRYDIYVMDPDGSDQIDLSQNNQTDDSRPRWSPNSQYLVFEGRYAAVVSLGKGINEIYMMQAAGGIHTNLAQLTQNNTRDADLHMDPVWSPDGNRIAYVSRKTGTYRIQVARFNTPTQNASEE